MNKLLAIALIILPAFTMGQDRNAKIKGIMAALEDESVRVVEAALETLNTLEVLDSLLIQNQIPEPILNFCRSNLMSDKHVNTRMSAIKIHILLCQKTFTLSDSDVELIINWLKDDANSELYFDAFSSWNWTANERLLQAARDAWKNSRENELLGLTLILLHQKGLEFSDLEMIKGYLNSEYLRTLLQSSSDYTDVAKLFSFLTSANPFPERLQYFVSTLINSERVGFEEFLRKLLWYDINILP